MSISTSLATLFILFIAASAGAAGSEAGKVTAATEVMDRAMAIPQRSIPKSLLDDASGIAIIPSAVSVPGGSGETQTGAARNEGILIARTDDGSWSHPVFVTLTGVRMGKHAENGASEMILVFKDGRTVDVLKGGALEIGVDAVPGPVGVSGPIERKANRYAYALIEQSLSGVSIEAATLRIDRNANATFYKRPGISPNAILQGKQEEAVAPAVSEFTCMIAIYSNAAQACS